MIKKISQIISTIFFVGYLPFSATLASVPAFFVFILYPNNIWILSLIIIISIISTDYFSKQIKNHDPKFIIIDELVGQLIAFYFISPTLIHLTISIFLFRLFDIKKPFLIKSSQKLSGGIGIVIDDVLAGIFANLCTRIISIFI